MNKQGTILFLQLYWLMHHLIPWQNLFRKINNAHIIKSENSYHILTIILKTYLITIKFKSNVYIFGNGLLISKALGT